MKLFKTGLKVVTAVAVFAVAVAVTGGNQQLGTSSAIAAFDIDKLTVGGDIRVRPEFRRGSNFGEIVGGVEQKANSQFIQQRVRLRINYDVSPDVSMFTELQDSRNWGSANTGASTGNAGANQNNINGDSFGLRQGYLLVKNLGVQGLSLKAGRQKVIFGDHRLLGSFDWNNVGFSFDGFRADYSSPYANHVLGWFRIAENNCSTINAGGCGGGSGYNATSDNDLIVFYNTFKQVPNMTIEPYIFYMLDSRGKNQNSPTFTPGGGSATASIRSGRVSPDQKRWFFGTRVNGKAVNDAVDYTGEIVWQTGETKTSGSGTALVDQTINAWAFAVKGGYTAKQLPWQPRFGIEIDFASGSSNSATDPAARHTFENLFPTNHLHYGFMDQMAWKNMVNYNPQVQLKPVKAGKLDIRLHILRLMNPEDNWYGAGQGPIGTSNAQNMAQSLGQEIDIIYTHSFKDGKLGLQLGYGHFFTGEYGARSRECAIVNNNSPGTCNQGGTGVGSKDQDWGYFQLTTKF